jgi:hypothetical protein
MSQISIYRRYRIHYVKGYLCWHKHYAAHRPETHPGDPFDLNAKTFDGIRAEIDLDDAERCSHGMSYDDRHPCGECRAEIADFMLDQKKDGDL